MSDATRLRRHPPYLLWLASDTAKGLAGTLFNFAMPLLTLATTHDPARAGIVAAVGTVIRLVMTLVGGVLADRHRRVVMMILGGAAGAIAAASFTLFALSDAITFAMLIVFQVVLAAVGAAFAPAGEAALKDLVPERMMGRAQAANQGRDAALQLAGSPIGGMLLAVGGWLVGAVMTVSSLVSAVAAFALGRHVGSRGAAATATRAPDDTVPRPNAARELREGVRWLFRRPDLSVGTVVAVIINLGLNAGLTTMTYEVLQAGYSEAVLGWMMAGSGSAMLAGAFIAPALVARFGAGTLMILAITACTGSIAAGIAVRSPLGITILACAAVVLLPALNAAFNGYTMVATPSDLIGRVNSVGSVLSMGAMPLSPLIAGFGLALVGRTTTLAFSLVVCALALALCLSSRSVRSIPAETGWVAHAAQVSARREAAG